MLFTRSRDCSLLKNPESALIRRDCCSYQLHSSWVIHQYFLNQHDPPPSLWYQINIHSIWSNQPRLTKFLQKDLWGRLSIINLQLFWNVSNTFKANSVITVRNSVHLHPRVLLGQTKLEGGIWSKKIQGYSDCSYYKTQWPSCQAVCCTQQNMANHSANRIAKNKCFVTLNNAAWKVLVWDKRKATLVL